MDVFQLRQPVIEEYGRFVRSFLTIRDGRIEELVERELAKGHPASRKNTGAGS